MLRNDLDHFHDDNYRSLCEELPVALVHQQQLVVARHEPLSLELPLRQSSIHRH
jgi:hypothetical protein